MTRLEVVQTDLHFYGTVPMSNAGVGPPAPTDRRFTNNDVVACYENLCHWARTADGLGFDTFWLTEHHFQHEGYEVTPNLVLFGVHLAGITSRLRFGQMFNVVPQWHPLRLAEDFAMADILTGGRSVFGVGRGTVPREAETLGAHVASGDNAMSREADRRNREMFEEGMEVIKAAWGQESFSHSGKHFTFPPPGIPDRGATVTQLSLVPRPLRSPVDIYQPVTSPATLTYAAQAGHIGVFALGSPRFTKANWDRFGQAAADGGRFLGPGEGRCLQLIVHVGATTDDAIRTARAGHDEHVKFLSQYGRFRNLVDGAAFNFAPTVEESRSTGGMAIGSVEEVADSLGRWRDLLDLGHLVVFPELPGLTRDQVDEQQHLLAEEVLPRIGVNLAA
ncbi:MAG: LLM class flavin-dependent oxidoreductase [Actinomycetota bacterium]|nr:LLM class flavin-dependent oxidoreductase [Actinomycetota bacterium]